MPLNGERNRWPNRIEVQRTFADFDDFWATAMLAPSTGPVIAAMPSDAVKVLKGRVRARLPVNAAGHERMGKRG